jgi:transcriptional regulator with XRE-family HTH domain
MPLDLDKIGRLLKSAREERGLTIEQAAARLFISKSKLDAVESGDWKRLPHQVYVRGYIIQYATFLNVLNLVQPELAAAEGDPDHSREQEASRRRLAIPMSQGLKKRIAGIGITAAVLLGFLIFMNIQRPPYTHTVQLPQRLISRSQPQTAMESAEPGNRREVISGAQAASSERQEEKAQAKPEQEGYQTVAGQDRSSGAYDKKQDKLVLASKKLMIACQERTWVAIVIDGTERKEFTLNPEEVVVLNANEKFDILIGNAGGVKLFINGKDVGFTGESGEVKRITLS